MNLKRNMRDWLKDTVGGTGVECPLPLLHLCTPFEAYSCCLEVVTLLGGEFSPHLDETFGGSHSKQRPALGVPGIA